MKNIPIFAKVLILVFDQLQAAFVCVDPTSARQLMPLRM